MTIKAVIFDMDGVLCDSEALIAKAAVRMFREQHGVDVLEEDFAPFVGTGEARYLGGVAEKYGIELARPADKDITYRMYLEMIPGNLRVLPGVHAFVERCRSEGLRTAVATSADRIKLDGNLREIGLPPGDFDAVITGSDITHPKPHPEIFTTAAAAIGVTPGACLVIEDSFHGVEAAHGAGCRCAALCTTFPPERFADRHPRWLFNDLEHALTQWDAILAD